MKRKLLLLVCFVALIFTVYKATHAYGGFSSIYFMNETPLTTQVNVMDESFTLGAQAVDLSSTSQKSVPRLHAPQRLTFTTIRAGNDINSYTLVTNSPAFQNVYIHLFRGFAVVSSNQSDEILHPN